MSEKSDEKAVMGVVVPAQNRGLTVTSTMKPANVLAVLSEVESMELTNALNMLATSLDAHALAYRGIGQPQLADTVDAQAARVRALAEKVCGKVVQIMEVPE